MSATEVTTVLSPLVEIPTPPNPTPASDIVLGDGLVTQLDLAAVNKTLAPIQEDLNDDAEQAMYPTVPVPTPATFSPAPSVVLAQKTRGRGFSILHERLSQLTPKDVGQATTTEGVREGSVWADEVMEHLDHALKRLRQLADDEEQVSGSKKAASVIFKERLDEALAAAELGFQVKVQEASEK